MKNYNRKNFQENIEKKTALETGIIENMMKIDIICRSKLKIGRRIHHALKSESKTFSTSDIVGIDLETYKYGLNIKLVPR